MKIKFSLTVFALLLGVQGVSQQLIARNDSFIFRSDTGLDYTVRVVRNDSSAINSRLTVYNVSPNSSLYNVIIPVSDSQSIYITSTTSDTFSGIIRYWVRDTAGNIDSALVSFKRRLIPETIYPSDANNDNLVNHFDIFPIGLMYNKYGEVRHSAERNTTFGPARAVDWSTQASNINGKYADVDGNGEINAKDISDISKHLGSSKGNYIPRLSDTNSLNTMRFNISDTVYLSSQDSGKIQLPIKMSSGIASYGIGYSMSVENRNKTNGLDTFYNKYSYKNLPFNNTWNNEPNNNLLLITDNKSRVNHLNIALSKTSGMNGGSSGDLGIVEIVVDDILLGLPNPGDVGRLHVSIKDIALIDNNYNLIPIKPVSKYIYIAKSSASIASNHLNAITVYPTLVESRFIIEKNNLQPIEYKIFNAIGQLIKTGSIKTDKTYIDCETWSTGLYYLRTSESNQTYKLLKQ